VVDRDKKKITFMASLEGGVEIESVAESTPEKIIYCSVDASLGLMPYQARYMGFRLNFNSKQIKQFTSLMMALGKLFYYCDLSLLEINPLVITDQGDLVCLDGKITIDDNALFRQPDLRELRDSSQEDSKEERAHQWDLSYVSLEGNIGCMVNGAGLAMATMDMIQIKGGKPANFLDVGGSATQERVVEAFKIILSDDSVQGVFVNIFGGIVRCDLIADGIIGAIKEVNVKVPVVVRLEGNNAALAKEKLQASQYKVIGCDDFASGAEKIVALVKQKGDAS
jgi:succinyl-CoA synthetase beta subunit